MDKFTVDIDTGGTFTDGFFTLGQRYLVIKVDTTPHDLTVCFNNCITEGAKHFGYNDVRGFLKGTKTIRLSSTVGTNSLIQRTGPKLGLIVTAGEEESLYQDHNPILNFLVNPDLVVGLQEETLSSGEIMREVNEDEVKVATKKLLEAGARMIVISFKNAYLNPGNEMRVREIIQQDFPKHYLGAKPILLASEVSMREDNGIRTNAAIVNAYLHRDMVKYLYKADEDVRQKGFTKPLLIAQANGGVARVAKTKAIDTYNSGPAAGLMGSKYIGDMYGLDHVLTVDVGGTSSDVGMITNGELSFDTASSIASVPVHTPLIHVLSVGGGGGSIAKMTKEGKVQVGPESAGAVPGPACFDLGGAKPTVTDAAVVLGLVDPDYFLGGKKKLKREKAFDVIQKSVAAPLQITVEKAAEKIIDELEEIGATALRQLCSDRGKITGDFTLFSLGGGGGLFSGGMAQKCGIKKVYTFPYSAVFSAFGLSTADVTHNYQERTDIRLERKQNISLDFCNEISQMVQQMRKLAYRDMRGEGFAEEAVQFKFSLEATGQKGKSREIFPIAIDGLELKDISKLQQELSKIFEQLNTDEIRIEFVHLGSFVNISKYQMPNFAIGSSDPSHAQKSERNVYWNSEWKKTPIYDLEKIKPGNVIFGPAVIESSNTSIVVKKQMIFKMDEHMNGIMEVLA
jgi:N-methylhydantoinase A